MFWEKCWSLKWRARGSEDDQRWHGRLKWRRRARLLVWRQRMPWIKREGEWEFERLLLEWSKSGHTRVAGRLWVSDKWPLTKHFCLCLLTSMIWTSCFLHSQSSTHLILIAECCDPLYRKLSLSLRIQLHSCYCSQYLGPSYW